MAETAPLVADDFAPLLAGVLAPRATGLVLAVSGGPDSMALLHLATTLHERGGLPPLTVGTVDHGLRPGSAADASRVEDAARARGLPVRRLVWAGPKPERAVQEKARVARYSLLLSLCAEVGADHLATAHTLDDQAETVLFRLLRGSGVAGLAAMRAVAMRGSVRHVRPLLGISKARLSATCLVAGIPVLHDPGNTDPRYARARMRRLLPMLAVEGCDAAALGRLASRAARADAALSHAASAAFHDILLPAEGGRVRLDGLRLAALPAEHVIRMLDRAIAIAGGTVRRLDGLERLALTLAQAAADGVAATGTLGGTVLSLEDDGIITVAREGLRRGRTGDTAGRPLPMPAAATPGASPVPWQG